ncbi:MAG: hypothetical protein PHW13_11545 [Methylococcales bacterium]|nr:hypothetical protein [Methylococcales bacterium]
MRILLIAIFSITLSVAAQFLFKTGMSSLEIKQALTQPLNARLAWVVLTNRFIIGGFSFYAIGSIVWLAVLSSWDVSKAYPLVGLGFALTAMVGFALGENITMHRILGILIICEGVWLVANT